MAKPQPTISAPPKKVNMKSNKLSGPNNQGPPPCPHRDLFHRVNYTYQASVLLQAIHEANNPSSSASSSSSSKVPVAGKGTGGRKGKGKAAVELGEADFAQLARNSMRVTKKLVAHNQLKLDPSIKRTICSTCSTVLVPGLTSRIRNRPSRSHFNVTNTTCLNCSKLLTIPSPPTSVLLSSLAGGTDKLDGPIRTKRRREVAERSRPAFFERERDDECEASTGHELWRGVQKLTHWGVGADDKSWEKVENDKDPQEGERSVGRTEVKGGRARHRDTK